MLAFAQQRGLCGSLLNKKTNKHEKTASELPKLKKGKFETLKGSEGFKNYLQV